MKDSKVFNTLIEVGLRAIFLLNTLKPLKLDLDRLNYLDYLLIYMCNQESIEESLHPEYPMMMIELFSKRELLKKSLMYIGNKGLISIECQNTGITYSSNANTSWFLDGVVDNDYSRELTNRAHAIKEKFQSYSNLELKEFIEKEIKQKENNFKDFFPYIDGGR